MEQVISSTKNELSEIINELESFHLKKLLPNNLIDELKNKLANRSINLTVLGEFNRGKSTFINSLIGQDLLPTGITPTTASINILKYSEKPYLKVINQDQVSEIKEIDVNTFLDLDYEKISYLELGYNSDFLKNIIVVDTPGVNDINKQRIEITYDFIPKSDAVIFLLDAEQVLSKSEFDFFQNKVLSNDINKIIFVINKTDNIQPEELKEIQDYAYQKITPYINEPVILTYSARKALQAKRDNSEQSLEDSNYHNLIKAISSNIFDKQDSILIERTTHNLGYLIKDLINKLSLEKSLFAKSVEELEENISYIKSQEDDLSKDLDNLLEDFKDKIKEIKEAEIAKLKNFSLALYQAFEKDSDELTYQDVKTYLPLFVQDKFKEQVELQEITIKADIIDAYQESVEKIGKLLENIKEHMNLKIDVSLVKVGSINKTSGLDIGSSVLMTSGLFVMFLGGLFPLIGGLLMIASGGFLSLNSKESMQKNLKDELKKIAHSSITGGAEKISIKISDIIDEISVKIQANLRELFKEEFESINNSINSVIESKKLKEVESSEKIAEIDQDLKFLADKLTQIKN